MSLRLWDKTYIANTIGNKYRRGSKALFRCPRHICHPDANNQTYNRAKESNNSISDHWRSGMVRPCTLPDHGTTGYYRKAAKNQEDETNIRYAA